jgi:Sjoegren syndrome nuclear autoantigen 1
MSIESSTMQDYNSQLVHCLDEIREKRDAITQQKSKREAEKVVLLTTMKKLQTELSQIEEDLVKYSTDSVKYNQTIQETETAYMKIVESSKTLLHVLREESNNN